MIKSSAKHWYFGSLHEDRIITQYHTCVFEKLLPVLPKSNGETEKELEE